MRRLAEGTAVDTLASWELFVLPVITRCLDGVVAGRLMVCLLPNRKKRCPWSIQLSLTNCFPRDHGGMEIQQQQGMMVS